MREKITDIIINWWDDLEDRKFAEVTDLIIAVFKEEIEKVGNQHLYFGSPHTERDLESNERHNAFEDCRQAILALFEEEQ